MLDSPAISNFMTALPEADFTFSSFEQVFCLSAIPSVYVGGQVVVSANSINTGLSLASSTRWRASGNFEGGSDRRPTVSNGTGMDMDLYALAFSSAQITFGSQRSRETGHEERIVGLHQRILPLYRDVGDTPPANPPYFTVAGGDDAPDFTPPGSYVAKFWIPYSIDDSTDPDITPWGWTPGAAFQGEASLSCSTVEYLGVLEDGRACDLALVTQLNVEERAGSNSTWGTLLNWDSAAALIGIPKTAPAA